MAFGGLFLNGSSATIRYGLTLGLHWVGTFPIAHRWYTVLQDGENGGCLLHLLCVASFGAFFVAALCSRIQRRGWCASIHMHWRGILVHMALQHCWQPVGPTREAFCFKDDTYVRIAGGIQSEIHAGVHSHHFISTSAP